MDMKYLGSTSQISCRSEPESLGTYQHSSGQKFRRASAQRDSRESLHSRLLQRKALSNNLCNKGTPIFDPSLHGYMAKSKHILNIYEAKTHLSRVIE